MTVHEVLVVFAPYIIQALVALFMAMISWVAYAAKKWLDFKLTDDQWGVVHHAASVAANRIVANMDATDFAKKQITFKDPFVQVAATMALRDIPQIADGLGVTPDSMGKLITGQLGAAQSHMIQVTVPVPAIVK